jgi:hypothetical protein
MEGLPSGAAHELLRAQIGSVSKDIDHNKTKLLDAVAAAYTGLVDKTEQSALDLEKLMAPLLKLDDMD